MIVRAKILSAELLFVLLFVSGLCARSFAFMLFSRGVWRGWCTYDRVVVAKMYEVSWVYKVTHGKMDRCRLFYSSSSH